MNENISKVISALTESESGKKQMEIWDWYQGVALYGLYLYYQKTKDQKVYDYLTNWFDRQIEIGEPRWNVNSLSPLLTLTYLYEISGKEEYLKLCLEMQYSWAITLKGNDEPIGCIDVVGENSVGVQEVGYVLAYDHWG